MGCLVRRRKAGITFLSFYLFGFLRRVGGKERIRPQVSVLPGCGFATQTALKRLAIATCGDLAAAEEAPLAAALGERQVKHFFIQFFYNLQRFCLFI